MKGIVTKIIVVLVLALGIGVTAAYLSRGNNNDESGGSKSEKTVTKENQVTITVEPTKQLSESELKQREVNNMLGIDTKRADEANTIPSTDEEQSVPEVDIERYIGVIEIIANALYNGFDYKGTSSSDYAELESSLDSKSFAYLLETLVSNERRYDYEMIDITEDVERITESKRIESERLAEYTDITYSEWVEKQTNKAKAEYNKVYPEIDAWQPWQRFVTEIIVNNDGVIVYDGTKSINELTDEEVEIIKEYYTSVTGNPAVLETDEQYYYQYGIYPGEANDNDDRDMEWFGVYEGIDWAWLDITEDEWNREYKFSNYTDDFDSRIIERKGRYYIDVNSIESNVKSIDINVYGNFISCDVASYTNDYTSARGDERYIGTIVNYDFWYEDNNRKIECRGYVNVDIWDNRYKCNVYVGADDKIEIDNEFIRSTCSIITDDSSRIGEDYE